MINNKTNNNIKLVETENKGEWLFVAASGMPIDINHTGETILSLDCEGAEPAICVGKIIPMGDNQPDKVVKKIFFKHNVGFIIVLEDVSKG